MLLKVLVSAVRQKGRKGGMPGKKTHCLHDYYRKPNEAAGKTLEKVRND